MRSLIQYFKLFSISKQLKIMCPQSNKNKCWICKQLQLTRTQYPLSTVKHLQTQTDNVNSDANRNKIQSITNAIIFKLNNDIYNVKSTILQK